ncbi:zinc-dependent metalloprotease [Marinigracilibium pacificum]|uniref:DUF5117 domain-containing protein n=1 Tax=Marinigracilibium pacificum TaxID=2729599 RepID=A0A848IXY8_9BACT|nr:zinc-dependent metalloprotease [Marinigracilibium pacificum]NMM46839.1 DUF5117 domain-containing protein [Marinigracilibium pacificum]
MVKQFRLVLLLIPVIFAGCSTTHTNSSTSQSDFSDSLVIVDGFLNYHIDSENQKVYLKIDHYDSLFLYINSLAAGVGSNDIGLDRGQLGNSRMVKFSKYGNKVLLIEPNSSYIADTDNILEEKAVEEAFAKSVLASFTLEKKKFSSIGGDWIDITDFLTRDSHGISKTLKNQGQGVYALDKQSSVIISENCFNFPQNTEFETMLTFRGEPKKYEIRSVTPSPDAVTVQVRNSFVALPDGNYKPVKFHPGSGYFDLTRYNYATPIDQPVKERFITRHRLEKKNPEKEKSEAVEPIVYYLDAGTPEPVRSALLDGARWWNQAFESAGYIDAFQVEILPDSIHPLDCRYNVIQWVHRSTRGWSYGMTIPDPRTGEIIKGMVTLGSLRVRQDFLIAQALVPAYGLNPNTAPHMALALARIRQLSAHEVGHTLGLAHNYASSAYGRESVMDYPHPYIYQDSKGNLKFDSAYDVGVGEWDKVAINFGYGDHSESERTSIITSAASKGIYFLSDQDARPMYGAHPSTHLWDNGTRADKELIRVLNIRKKALSDFGVNNLADGRPYSDLEEILAPLYFFHRYQLEAAVKIIGGVDYRYSIKGEGNVVNSLVAPELQREALGAILQTVTLENLQLNEEILKVIPPKSYGDYKGRESLIGKTDPVLDPVSIAESASSYTYGALLNAQRMNRLAIQSSMNDELFSAVELMNIAYDNLIKELNENSLGDQIIYSVRHQLIRNVIMLAENSSSSVTVKSDCISFLSAISNRLGKSKVSEDKFLKLTIDRYLNGEKPEIEISPTKMPDGSPIGSGLMCY